MKKLTTQVLKELATSLAETIPSGFRGLYAMATGLWMKKSDGTSVRILTTDDSLGGGMVYPASGKFGYTSSGTAWTTCSLNWDETNKRLGIGRVPTAYPLEIEGNVNGQFRFQIQNTSTGNAAMCYGIVIADGNRYVTFGQMGSGVSGTHAWGMPNASLATVECGGGTTGTDNLVIAARKSTANLLLVAGDYIRMIVSYSGKIGVGYAYTDTLINRFNVKGNIKTEAGNGENGDANIAGDVNASGNLNSDANVNAINGYVFDKGIYSSIYAICSTYYDTINDYTWTKLTGFLNNGDYSNMQVDQSNDKITINEAGLYQINFSGCFLPTANNIDLDYVVYLNGSMVTSLVNSETLNTKQLSTVALSGQLRLNKNDFLEIWVIYNSGGAISSFNLMQRNLNLSLQYLGV